jgi:hypothetical protein
MKKVFTLNRVEATIPTTCCNLFKKIDEFNHRNSEKIFLEKKITAEFNKVGSQGFQYEDEKVFSHNLFVENNYKAKGKHGVYRFKDSDRNHNYEFYFGPLIKVDEKTLGCGSFGTLGCSPKGMGCKMNGVSCKSIGCKDKGGDNAQHLNFLDDSKNEKEVSILNKHFGLRKLFDRKKHDYLYQSKESIYVSLSEYIKDNFEAINQQFEKDINSISEKGLTFDRVVDIPSYTDMFSQGILFSSHGKDKVGFADASISVDGYLLYLSRFDVWYFPKVKGLISKILEILFLIPILGWILKLIFGKEEKEITGTDIISDKNIEKLNSVYERDFNEQENLEKQYSKDLAELKEKFISKIPVTIAVRRSTSWFNRLLNGEKYDFFTYYANGVKK